MDTGSESAVVLENDPIRFSAAEVPKE